MDGVGRLNIVALAVHAGAGKGHRRREHQRGIAVLVKLGVLFELRVADRGGEGLVQYKRIPQIPAVDLAAGVEHGKVVAQTLAGVIREQVVAVARIALIALQKGDLLVGRVLIDACICARARVGARVEQHLDDLFLRHAGEHGLYVSLNGGQAVVEHDARDGHELQKLVIAHARRVGRDDRAQRVGLAVHKVLNAPADKLLIRVGGHVRREQGHGLLALGQALVLLAAVDVREGHVQDHGIVLVGRDQQLRHHKISIVGQGRAERAVLDRLFELGIAHGALVRIPDDLLAQHPAGALYAGGQRVGERHVLVARGQRHRADDLAAVIQHQLQIGLFGAFGGAVGLVIGAHLEALEGALGLGQAGGDRAEAFDDLLVAEGLRGLEHHAADPVVVVDAAPVRGVARSVRDLRDGLGGLVLVQAHGGQRLEAHAAVGGGVVEREHDALALGALYVHVEVAAGRAGLVAGVEHFIIGKGRLALGKRKIQLAVGRGQHPVRALGGHVGQVEGRVRRLGAEREGAVDAVVGVHALVVIEGDVVDGKLLFDLEGGVQRHGDGAELAVHRLIRVCADDVLKGHKARARGAEGARLAIAAGLPAGVRIGVVLRQGGKRHGGAALQQRRLQQQRARVAVVHIQVQYAQGRSLAHAAHEHLRVGGGEEIHLRDGQVLRAGFRRNFGLFRSLRHIRALGRSGGILRALGGGGGILRALRRSSGVLRALGRSSGVFRALGGSGGVFRALGGGSGVFRALGGGSGVFRALSGGSGVFRALSGGGGVFRALGGGSGVFRALGGSGGIFRAIGCGRGLARIRWRRCFALWDRCRRVLRGIGRLDRCVGRVLRCRGHTVRIDDRFAL